MSQKKLMVLLVVIVALAAIPLVSMAQAPQGQGQQPPADGQRRGGARGEGRGRGGDGQAAPRGDGQGRGGDARGAQGARGAAQAPPAPQMIKQVKPGVYMVINGGGNSTVRVTDQGVILVDTKNLGDQFYNELLGQIKTVTNQPVKYAFVTHVHQDHAGNIGKFVQAGAQVITNDGLKRNLETGGPDGKGYTSAAGKPAAPNVTYAKNKKIKLGTARAEAYHFGRAHTGGDTVVYFPDVKVVSLGDEFVAAQPNADYPMGGSLLEWSKVLTQVLKLDFDTAIPGHGNDPLTK